MNVVITKDKMAAYIVLGDGPALTLDEALEHLKTQGVVYGVSPPALRTALSGSKGIPYQVAWGRKPPDVNLSNREPAVISKYPQSKGRPSESIKSDESFMYNWRRLINRGSVREGAVLAFIRNPDSCGIGLAVTGESVLYFAKKVILKCGENACVSNDGNKIVAKKSGIPYMDEDGTGVLDHIEIDGHVCAYTGNLQFPGDMIIKGDVSEGFKVAAWGGVVIGGTLAGSVSAAGNVSVGGGIKATGEVVESGGLISARFCENSILRAYGDIIMKGSILHSIVEAERSVKISSPRGSILGGLVRAGMSVLAPVIGSPIGVATVIETGISPRFRRERVRLEHDLTKVKADLNEAKRYSLGFNSSRLDSGFDSLRLKRMQRLLEEREKGLIDRIAELDEYMKKEHGGYVEAGRVEPGTKIVIGTQVTEFNNPVEDLKLGVMVSRETH